MVQSLILALESSRAFNILHMNQAEQPQTVQMVYPVTPLA